MKPSKLIVIFLLFFANIFSLFSQETFSNPIRFKNAVIQPEKGIPGENTFKNDLSFGKYYLIIQFKEIPSLNEQLELKANGISLLVFISENAYYASVIQSSFGKLAPNENIKSVFSALPATRTDLRIFDLQNTSSGNVDLSILVFEDVDLERALPELTLIGGNITGYSQNLHHISLSIPVSKITELSKIPWILWMEPSPPPVEEMNLVEKTLIGSSLLDAPSKNLTGDSIKIGEWDAGAVGSHIDYNSRLILCDNPQTVHNHATHVAGTMSGAGIVDPLLKGMASKSTIYSWNFFGNILYEMDSSARTQGIEITQNSYAYDHNYDTCNHRGYYDITSYLLDELVINYPYLIHVFAAANYQSECGQGGFRTVSSGFQPAKNIIVVGAVNAYDQMSSFSCWGPVRDNRLKPEICTDGVNVNSTLPGNIYSGSTWNGTSMACPGASGTIAQLCQRYKQLFNTMPDVSIIKALVCNTAIDLGNSGPDYKFGFGRMNGFYALKAMEEKRFIFDSLGNGSSVFDTIQIPANVRQLKILLCWSDPPASPSIPVDSVTLINHLNLSVSDSANSNWLPLILNASSPNSVAVQGIDTLNNTQQVVITNPHSGRFFIKVQGTKIPLGKQKYTVTYETLKDEIKITYPNGGESFTPQNSEVIRWYSVGNTGNFTLQYSINNGTSWNTISSSISSATRYYSWNVPDTFSSQCLIRITSGNNLTDVSDSVYSIMYRPSGILSKSCNNQVHFYWPKTKRASKYDVFLESNGQWQKLGQTSDTFYTVRNLSNLKTYWFSVSAVSAGNAISLRAIAVSAKPDSTLFAPEFLIQPVGDTLCSGNSITFRTSAKGNQPFTRFWEKSIDHGSSWQKISGMTDTSLMVSNISKANDFSLYRTGWYNACKSISYSTNAEIRVDTGIVFNNAPSDVITCIDDTVLFTVSLKSLTPFSLLWQENPGSNWINLNLEKDTILEISKVPYSKNNYTYRVKVSNLCVTDTLSASAKLIIHPQLSVSIANMPDTVCYGTKIQLNAIPSGGDTLHYNFLWLPDSVSAVLYSDTLYSEKKFKVLLNDFCSASIVSDSVLIHVRPPLAVSLNHTDTTLCQGNNLVLKAYPSGGKKASYSFKWNNLAGSSDTLQLSPVQTKKYFVELTDGCSANKAVDSAEIKVSDTLRLKVFSQPDTTVCKGVAVSLSVSGSGGNTANHIFEWNQGSFTGKKLDFNAEKTTTYTIRLKDGCSVYEPSDSVVVHVLPALSVSLNTDADTVCKGTQIKLTASGNGGTGKDYHYNWSNSSPDKSQIDLLMMLSEEIIVEMTDNCTVQPAFDTVFIFVPILNSDWSYIDSFMKITFSPSDIFYDSYRWTFGDGDSSGLVSPIHLYQNEGDFLVCLTVNKFGCIEKTCKKLNVKKNAIQVNDFSKSVNLWPNPSFGKIYINSYRLPSGTEILVFNSIGQKVYEQNRLNKTTLTTEIDLEGQSEGIYRLIIKNEQFVIEKHFVILK